MSEQLLTDDEKPESCQCCGWDTEDLLSFSPPGIERTFWLCWVCDCSFASKAEIYPRQVDLVDVLKTIAWGINYLKESGGRGE